MLAAKESLCGQCYQVRNEDPYNPKMKPLIVQVRSGHHIRHTHTYTGTLPTRIPLLPMTSGIHVCA